MEKNSIIIKKADTTDINNILSIEKTLEYSLFSKDTLLNDLNNEIYLYLIAYDNDLPVGFIGFSNLQYTLDLLYIAVLKEKRKSKIGTKLFLCMEDFAKKNKIEKIMLEVRVSNISAIKFYKSFDFKEIGIRKNYYKFPLEDAIIFEKKLID